MILTQSAPTPENWRYPAQCPACHEAVVVQCDDLSATRSLFSSSYIYYISYCCPGCHELICIRDTPNQIRSVAIRRSMPKILQQEWEESLLGILSFYASKIKTLVRNITSKIYPLLPP